MLTIFAAAIGYAAAAIAAPSGLEWPEAKTQAKPHAYWWWMGSAVDATNISKELTRYRDAGMGGVHIIPIYGAKGWESNYTEYLSPKWMEMLDHSVKEAKRLGLEVDMTTGTGWCFGGPRVTDEEANALMVSSRRTVAAGEKIQGKLDRSKTQALMAFEAGGGKADLLGRISGTGAVDWVAPGGKWTVYAISQKPSGQKVKRSSPGGGGWMLNLAYPKAMTNYLRWMDEGFGNYRGAMPRAQYHDSYEYRMDWSPALFAEFEKRRGYRLQDELESFLTGQPADRAARVKCDYRETISDIMAEQTLPMWVNWSHAKGCLTRNEAHGSPGNWLDLYAAADIPETEMFRKDRSILVSKFASSAAHVAGKPFVGAETGTWLKEHFTETLADMKFLLDDLFLSGVNHVFYHGTCYSPEEAPWPGWVFYASYEMNPRNSVWHDVAALNSYAMRAQSVLQSGRPDNDILLYWPIHELWSYPEGMARNLGVHARDWFEDKAIGKTAEKLWKSGFQFDYVSDRQLLRAVVVSNTISTAPNGNTAYRTVIVPECRIISDKAMNALVGLAQAGGTVVFAGGLPEDVAGLDDLESRRQAFSAMKATVLNIAEGKEKCPGRILIGSLDSVLPKLEPGREAMFDTPGLMCIRRSLPDGRYYFIANRGDDAVDTWVPLATVAKSVAILDPLTGRTGWAAIRPNGAVRTEVRLSLTPGGSIILRTFDKEASEGPAYPIWQSAGDSIEVKGTWQVKFLSGGPKIPADFSTERLASWTESGDTNASSFGGTAVYSLKFDLPGNRKAGQAQQLDLGKVCQSARVRFNGKDLGTLFVPPFRIVVDNLQERENLLEVEVTNTSANRIRDMDRRGVQWQNFHDINFVNSDYKKFDASNWPLSHSGLLGPVTLAPVRAAAEN